MRICLIATNGFSHDPRARSTAHQLVGAGHEVVVVASGQPRPEPSPFPTTWIPTSQPDGTALGPRIRRVLQSEESRTKQWYDRLTLAAVGSEAAIFHACSDDAVPIAARAARISGGTVTRRPDWSDAGDVDLVTVAPTHPEANPTSIAPPLNHHTPSDHRAGYHPSPDRHAGRRLALIYRKTDTNPGRYLEDALRRAGVDVVLITDDLDWSAIGTVDAAVFVESPPPAVRITGSRPDIPVAYWAHHGEHHLAANLRLTRRFEADVVLLAHSWHLTHYFPVPVVRYPFGIPTDTFGPITPFNERSFDVAMVGAHLRSGGPYPFRHALVNGIEGHLAKNSTAFEQGVPRARMAEVYTDARIVPNEGGVRHFPITMRVFEAIAAGAVLWTRPVPGLDQLFIPEQHYVTMHDNFLAQLDDLLTDRSKLARIASAARAHGLAHHTYDHRVDELLAILDAIPLGAAPAPSPPRSDPLVARIEYDIEVQRILDATDRHIAEAMPDREVWTIDQVPSPSPASFGAVVIDSATPAPHLVVAAARQYVYAPDDEGPWEALVREAVPHAVVEYRNGVMRADLLPSDSRGTILS